MAVSDAPLICEEHHDPANNRTLRLTVESDGTVYVSVETASGPLQQMTMRGGYGLLIWLEAQAERARFAIHRQEAA
jgi:hypothetical protein